MPSHIRKKTAVADIPDLRDWIYRPDLRPLPRRMPPPPDVFILDQGDTAACTGFALAAAINHQYRAAGEPIRVSPRMLYEMAKRHDEWPGEAYAGSSLRGAIKGWANMGVCRDTLWPFHPGRVGRLTVRRAKDARNHVVGAYYRVLPELSHCQAALNEAGVLVASAQVHDGWDDPENGVIQPGGTPRGGHAFAVVGYDERGFWVQNSWGRSWGRDGLALWTYEDWIDNVWDTWVFRLAPPAPSIFGQRPRQARSEGAQEGMRRSSVPRRAIAGHFVHVDDGRYDGHGRYWSSADDVDQTARLVAESDRYDHVLFYVHGGLNSPTDSARRIDAMRDVFKANGIYPFHVMYDTGLGEELWDIVRRKGRAADARVGGFTDWTDRFLERLLRRPGTLVWEEMKRDARAAFSAEGAATDALLRFMSRQEHRARPLRFHLVGHSTGAVAIGALLYTLRRRRITFETCSLMAPACTLDDYRRTYLPALRKGARLRIREMAVYNLVDSLEQDDDVAGVYRKSLLYLVSNAFERVTGAPLLGMERFSRGAPTVAGLPRFHYSDGHGGEATRSTTHGGFDNDPWTMNHILRRILGGRPRRGFTAKDLDY